MDMMQIEWSSPHDACDDAVFAEPFEDRVERWLKPLWGVRVRVSLFSIRIRSLSPEQTFLLTRHALAHAGATGSLKDGSGGLLYVGPRPDGPDGDHKLERRIADVMGWTVFYLTHHRTAADVDVVAVHRWLDQIADPSELLDELTWSLANASPHPALRLNDA